MALALAAGLLQAETASADSFRRVAQTAHAHYYAPRGLKVDARRSEAFLERLFSLFGGAPQGWRLEYYRHRSVAELAAQVGFAAYGVTDTRALRIDSVLDYHPHELVHAVAARFGQPPVMFTEGLAVALTAQGRWRGRDLDAVAREYLTARGGTDRLLRTFAEQDPDRDYAVAGSFVGFLLDAYGIQPMVEFLEGCGPDPMRYPLAVRTAYGLGLADLEHAWRRQLVEAGASPTRDWYDPTGWPQTLRRSSTSSATPALAAASGTRGSGRRARSRG